MPCYMKFGRGRNVVNCKVRRHLRNQATSIQAKVEAFAASQQLEVKVSTGEMPWCLVLTCHRQDKASISRRTEHAIRVFADSLVNPGDNLFVCCPEIRGKRPGSMAFLLQIDDMGPFVVKDPDPDDGKDPFFPAVMK